MILAEANEPMHADSEPLETWKQKVKTEIGGVWDQLVGGKAYSKGQEAGSGNRPRKTRRAINATSAV